MRNDANSQNIKPTPSVPADSGDETRDVSCTVKASPMLPRAHMNVFTPTPEYTRKLNRPQTSKDNEANSTSNATDNSMNNTTMNSSSMSSSYGRLNLNSSFKLLGKDHCSGTMLSTLINYANLTSCNIDMRLSENKVDISRGLDGLRSMLDVIPAINTAVAGIQSSFNEFRQKFDEQNSQLVELGKSHSRLINVNEILKNNLNRLTAKLADVESIVQSSNVYIIAITLRSMWVSESL